MKIRIILISLILCAVVLGAIEIPDATIPRISVSITGYVKNPGAFGMNQTDRISDLLKKAEEEDMLSLQKVPESPQNSLDLQALNPIPEIRQSSEEEADELQALRHVELKRGGESRYYDLMRYYRLGELEQNPVLRDGDLVHIGMIQDIVSISGSVGSPGDLEFKAGDTLQDILGLAHNMLPGADASAIRIGHWNRADGSWSFESVNLRENPDLLQMPIRASDQIMVPFDAGYRAKKTVVVSGEVMQAGEYIVAEDTTVWDVLELAGGLTDKADPDNAVMLNREYNEIPNAEFERLKLRGMAELSPLEYTYIRTLLRQSQGPYALDFGQLVSSEGTEGNRLVNHLDYIYIPQKLNTVWVNGQVKNPGLVEYQAGKSWEYYIQKAGGYASNYNKHKVRILKANSGNWVKAKANQEILPGDIVFVPDKIDRSLWTDIKDIAALAASTITIIIGVHNLTK